METIVTTTVRIFNGTGHIHIRIEYGHTDTRLPLGGSIEHTKSHQRSYKPPSSTHATYMDMMTRYVIRRKRSLPPPSFQGSSRSPVQSGALGLPPSRRPSPGPSSLHSLGPALSLPPRGMAEDSDAAVAGPLLLPSMAARIWASISFSKASEIRFCSSFALCKRRSSSCGSSRYSLRRCSSSES
jgi:hypothetical protein